MIMTNSNDEPNQQQHIPAELVKAIRDEAFSQAAKWLVYGVISLASLAFIGWWLYLKPVLISTLGGVPTGAVAAFDLRERCPDGWSDFDALRGRVIIGAGKGDGLAQRDFGQLAGAEKVTLTLRQIPPHTHPYTDWGPAAGSCSFSGCNGSGSDRPLKTGSSGGNDSGGTDPFEILPPYLAMRMCKKS
jgi:hypothetical protein